MIQYITNTVTEIKPLLDEGLTWVQLRVKDKSESEIEHLSEKALEIMHSYNAALIINDNVHIAKKVGAHGVHLGRTDMDVIEARKIVGNHFIIGGSSNTIEDIKYLIDSKVNYIGLGPLRFTETKQNLNPVIGLEGYKNIISQLPVLEKNIPIIAIGGIVPNDVKPLLEAGVFGIAVSGAIGKASNPAKAFKEFQEQFQFQQI